MTTPDGRMHGEDAAEGAERPGADVEGRTPHPQEPAEGVEQPPADGAETD